MEFMVFAILVFLKLQAFPVRADQQVPCYFIFGDSLVDSGNNNVLPTTAKANYPPYGIDFPNGYTGRFTDGLTMADIIAELLGFVDYIPPYVAAASSNIIKGVNYASGGGGIRVESGKQLGTTISFNGQLLNHGVIVSRIKALLGGRFSVQEYLGRCFYYVGLGSNDYINNYFMPQIYPTSRIYTPEQYASVLIQQYSQQLTTLYNYGARKIAIFGLGLLGCIPQEVATYDTNGSPCVDSINSAVQLFNNRLKPLVDDLNTRLSGAKFIFLNFTSIQSGDPSVLGIKVLNESCCIVREGLCLPGGVPCSNRKEYLFYDNFHPTEVLNRATATRSYNALLPTDAYPTDIHHLVQL